MWFDQETYDQIRQGDVKIDQVESERHEGVARFVWTVNGALVTPLVRSIAEELLLNGLLSVADDGVLGFID